MNSLNEGSATVVETMIADAERLGLGVHRLECGTTWIDCGIEVSGSFEAGRLYALACLGGEGDLAFSEFDLQGSPWPALSLTLSSPLKSCMGCQYAGWEVKYASEGKSRRALGSGPARMLGSSEALLDRLNLRERSSRAVLALETRKKPGDELALAVAERCSVVPEELFLLAAPTASLVGSVQIAARIVETGIHKMIEEGLPVGGLLSAWGRCPLPPVAADDLTAMGRTNDAVLYGGTAWYAFGGDDALLASLSDRLVSASSGDYGRPFLEIFQAGGGDFYKIDPALFSPAEVFVNSVATGRTFHAGRRRDDLLARSWLG